MNISDTLRMMHGVALCAAKEPPALKEAQEPRAEAQVLGSSMLDRLPLAMAYVPMQTWGETYEGLKALDVGTIFPDLDMPFCGRRLSESWR